MSVLTEMVRLRGGLVEQPLHNYYCHTHHRSHVRKIGTVAVSAHLFTGGHEHRPWSIERP
jgi:hypothetical protein